MAAQTDSKSLGSRRTLCCFFPYPGRTRLVFTCVLPRFVASTVLLAECARVPRCRRGPFSKAAETPCLETGWRRDWQFSSNGITLKTTTKNNKTNKQTEKHIRKDRPKTKQQKRPVPSFFLFFFLFSFFLLSFLSVLGRLVLSQLNEHLNHNNLLSAVQSAYRPNHNTETVTAWATTRRAFGHY